MGLAYNVVYGQLLKYHKDANALQKESNELMPKELQGILPPVISIFGDKIEAIGKSVEELCRDAFGGTDKENDPFYGMGYNAQPNESEAEKIQHRVSHNRMMLNSLRSFIERKIDKTSRLLDSEIYEKEDVITNTSPSNPHTTIDHVDTYVAGDAINITNITNILNQLEKELEKETNLSPQVKNDLQNLIQEESTSLSKLKEGFAKYAGKFTGHALRTLLGLPED